MKPFPPSWRSLGLRRCTHHFYSYPWRLKLARASTTAEVDQARAELAEDLNWARSTVARRVLSQPPFLKEEAGGDAGALESLDVYLKVPCTNHLSSMACLSLCVLAVVSTSVPDLMGLVRDDQVWTVVHVTGSPLDHDTGPQYSPPVSCPAPLQARRWTAPPGPAKRFLSHILTYPLTLAAGLEEAGIASWGGGTRAAEEAAPRVPATEPPRRPLSVVCIGARAEGSLPPSLWLEALFALPGVSHLDLHLVGPEVAVPPRQLLEEAAIKHKAPSPNPSGTVSAKGGSDRPKLNLSLGSRTLAITWTRALVGGEAQRSCHPEERGRDEGATTSAQEASAEAAGIDETLAGADAYVLFNPGLGHPHLVRGWEPATELILRRSKPVILTGNNGQDLDRDVRQLGSVGERCCAGWKGGRGKRLSLKRNAFGSLRRTEDPLAAPGTELVSPNWGILVLRAPSEPGGEIPTQNAATPA